MGHPQVVKGEPATSGRAVAALVSGALVWGLIWYPYRVLAAQGMGGVAATAVTYAVALLILLAIMHRQLLAPAPWPLLLALAGAAAGCNIGYVLATLHGEVVRVLLLFYLAPLWTIMLSRLLLDERLTSTGWAVIALSLVGAVTMLWHPVAGLPLPRDGADWLGLMAGFSFALFNVLSRKAAAVPVAQRLFVSFAGVVGVGLVILLLTGQTVSLPGWSATGLLLLVGGLLLVINLVVQYGLEHTPANRAIVIMLSEVGFAAVSAWILAGEAMGIQEWMGGAMIVAASVFSSRMVDESH